MTIKIKKDEFSGVGRVFDGTLADAIRGLAQYTAREKIRQFADPTDNSTGTASYPAVAAALKGSTLPAFTEAGTLSAQDAATDTAIGKIKNAHSVLARFMNTLNAAFGLPLITDASGGTVATAGTIPAMDLSVSGVASSCLNVVTARVTFQELAQNAANLVGYANRIAVACGKTKIENNIGVAGFNGGGLSAVTATGTAVDGTADSTVTAANITAELAAHANLVATIALALTDLIGAQAADLTGNANGTASVTDIEAMTIPSVAVAGAATTSSPKAGFDTAIANVEDAICEVGTRVNYLLRRNNLPGPLTDSTGVTANGALPDTAVNLTAVDGSSGTNAVDFTTGVARMATIRNAIASLTDRVNDLCPVYGLPTLTDASGGTVGDTLANIAATGTGVGGAASTILDTVADAFLLATCNNLASLMGKVNAMTSSTNTGAQLVTEEPLPVVAFDA